MNALMALCLWMAIGGYVVGKKRGHPWLYAVASVPVTFGVYTLMIGVIALAP